MNASILPRPRAAVVLLALCVAAPARAQQPAAGGLAVQIAPHAYVVTDRGLNMVLIVGERGSMVAGVQSPALVEKARRALAALHAPPVRYALPMMRDSAVRYGDGGWEAQGALAIAPEGLRYAILRAQHDTSRNAVRLSAGMHLPSIGYSAVVQIGLDSIEDAHAVKQPAGYSDADVAVHFERGGFLYLSSFTTDGYPEIDIDRDGTIAGLIETATAFEGNFAQYAQVIEPIVPARGPLATIRDLRAFRDMLLAVRERLVALRAQGKTADDAVAAHPTAQFDARWGHGPVTPERFVRMAFASLAKEDSTAASH